MANVSTDDVSAVSADEASPLAALIRTRRRWGPLFEALIRNTGMGIYAVDPGGQYVIFNPECERLTGFTERQMTSAVPSRTPSPFQVQAPVPPTEDRPAIDLLRPEPHLFTANAPASIRQVQLPTANGSRRWVEITCVPVGGPEGRTELVVGFLRDIHEQKLLQSHMARLEKLAALGELTASIAHEVRNPLAAMKLGLDAELADELVPDSPAVEIAHEVSAEVNRLDRVVSRLLDFARVKESEFQPIDLQALVERTLGYVRNQAKARRVELKVQNAADLKPVRCDPDQIQQVLLNVILNAFHAMKAGGADAVARPLRRMPAAQRRARPRGANSTDRYRRGHPRRRTAQGVRPVLLHPPRRHRAGAVGQLPDGEPPRRRHRHRERSRPRHHRQHHAARGRPQPPNPRRRLRHRRRSAAGRVREMPLPRNVTFVARSEVPHGSKDGRSAGKVEADQLDR